MTHPFAHPPRSADEQSTPLSERDLQRLRFALARLRYSAAVPGLAAFAADPSLHRAEPLTVDDLVLALDAFSEYLARSLDEAAEQRRADDELRRDVAALRRLLGGAA